MKVTMSFKNLKHSPAVEEKIHTKSDHLAKFLGERVHAKWTCYSKEGLFYCELSMTGPQTDYHAKSYGENLYKCFDLVVTKMEKQLEKKKDKFKNKLHHHKNREIVILDPEMAWTDQPERNPRSNVA